MEAYRDSGFEEKTGERFASLSVPLHRLKCDVDSTVVIDFKIETRYPREGGERLQLNVSCTWSDQPLLMPVVDLIRDENRDHPISLPCSRFPFIEELVCPTKSWTERVIAVLPDSVLTALAHATELRIRVHSQHGICEAQFAHEHLALIRYYARQRRL
jgi:hypothetical protein